MAGGDGGDSSGSGDPFRLRAGRARCLLALTTYHLLLSTQYSLLSTHYSLLTTHYLGTYWHGAPPAETVWRDARVEPPAAVEGGGEGGGAPPPPRFSGGGKQPPQQSVGDGKQPPERAIDVLSAIQLATQHAYSMRASSGAAAGSKSRAGAPFQRGDLGAQLERAIQATTSRPTPFEWGGSSGSGGGGGGIGSIGSGSGGSSGDERLLLLAASLRGEAGVNQSRYVT